MRVALGCGNGHGRGIVVSVVVRVRVRVAVIVVMPVPVPVRIVVSVIMPVPMPMPMNVVVIVVVRLRMLEPVQFGMEHLVGELDRDLVDRGKWPDRKPGVTRCGLDLVRRHPFAHQGHPFDDIGQKDPGVPIAAHAVLPFRLSITANHNGSAIRPRPKECLSAAVTVSSNPSSRRSPRCHAMPLNAAASVLSSTHAAPFLPGFWNSLLPAGAVVAVFAYAARLKFRLGQVGTRLAAAESRAVQARESVVHQARMVAAISHDLRQPLAAAAAHRGVLQARLEAGQVDAARVQSQRLGTALDGLGHCLEHLLAAARGDAGIDRITPVPVDLHPLLREVTQAHAGAAAQAGLRLVLRLPDAALPVQSDPVALHRVLGNLISNAVRYAPMRAGPACGIVVRARRMSHGCRVHVADTGPGIPAARQRAVWEPCVRFGGGSEADGRGLGLGLYLVKRLLTQLDGHRIRMRSRLGRGTRFTLDLPFAH